MEAFAIYLVKANVVISALFLGFFLLVRNEKFFQLNRVLLLVILLMSILLPLLPSIDQVMPGQGQFDRLQFRAAEINPLNAVYSNIRVARSDLPAATQAERESHSIPDTINRISFVRVLAGLYVLVALILLLRFGYQLARIGILLHRNNKTTDGMLYTNLEMPPFSFFHFLVINRDRYTPEQFRQIVAHERVHIGQMHTVDVLLAELVSLLLWINPLVVILKRYVKLNLEYIADENMLAMGIDRQSYQWNILQTSVQPAAYPLTNLFNSSKTKLRIKMMNSERIPSHAYKYAFVLPVLFASYFIINPMRLQAQGEVRQIHKPLEALEGTYQSEKNTDAYIKVSSAGKSLKLKQDWDGQELTFDQVKPFEFLASGRPADHPFRLSFTAGVDGNVNEVIAFDRDRWLRVAGDKPTPIKVVQLPPEQLKAFEGFYRGENNVDAVLEFAVKGNALTAKQIWDGHEYILEATSDIEFISRNEAYPAKFIKDSQGVVTQVLVFHKDLWNKTNDYNPLQEKEVQLSAQQLKALEGYYQYREDKKTTLQIIARGNGIVLHQLWDSKDLQFVPTSPLEFSMKDNPGKLEFSKNKNGEVTQLLAFHKDWWDKVKDYKPAVHKEYKLSAVELKAFEGKYVFQKESTAFIQIFAKEDHLVLKQGWDAMEFNFTPESPLEFFVKGREFPLKFTKDKEGHVTQVLAFDRDVWDRVKE